MEALTKRARGVALAACGLVLSCGPGEVDLAEELPGDPYCLLVIGTHGYFEDGSSLMIGEWEESRVLGGCECLTAEELESGVHLELMHQRALEECQRYAAMQDYVYDECLEDFEAGGWLYPVFSAGPGSAYEDVPPPQVRCAGS